MALLNSLLITVVVVAFAADQAFATDYIVGDDAGWKLGVNYTAWAEGKQFFVGDQLVFKYGQGAHNVHRVNGTEFQQCMVPSTKPALTSGNDVITLATPGRKWYICGVGSHCASGMKLVITVSSSNAPASAPTPTPGISGVDQLSASSSYVWMFAALAIIKMLWA